MTLIQRLAAGADDDDWRAFINDYWGSVCRFAQGRGNLKHEDAEDVAAEVFEAILKNRLLERWSKCQSAKLRTLICYTVRSILCNRHRIESERKTAGSRARGKVSTTATPKSRARTKRKHAGPTRCLLRGVAGRDSRETAVNNLFAEYRPVSARGDYFRVLYGPCLRAIVDARHRRDASNQAFFGGKLLPPRTTAAPGERIQGTDPTTCRAVFGCGRRA